MYNETQYYCMLSSNLKIENSVKHQQLISRHFWFKYYEFNENNDVTFLFKDKLTLLNGTPFAKTDSDIYVCSFY
jgi:hypothetical protein